MQERPADTATQPLIPAALPLHGARLIEASAGTGKTWTIAALYLRLVLGHGDTHTAFGANAYAHGPSAANADADDTAPLLRGRPLTPPEILVMTFTRAATRELSERIRARLVEALAAFRAQGDAPVGDAFLAELLAAHPSAASRKRAAWLLEQAAATMDEAAIHTIDAWCQRVLREHALSSGVAWDEHLDDNPQAMLATAALDYWREQVYPASDAEFEAIAAIWADPDALVADIERLHDQPMPAGCDAGTLAQVLARATQSRQSTLADIAAGWVDKAQQLHDWLDAQTTAHKSDWNGRQLRHDWAMKWAAALQNWARQPHLQLADELGTGAKRLSVQGLTEARKGPALSPKALPAAIGDLPDLLATLAKLVLPDPVSAARAHAASHVARRLQWLRAQGALFGFADLQRRLDRALAEPASQTLCQRLRQQYPVALVDEFQDTSALQYRLFARIYGLHAKQDDEGENPNTNNALFLIGDPKQSIYRFRGADIESYLRARAATAGRHYVLDTNRRSSRALVRAVNSLFERAEHREGAGAFGYRGRAGKNSSAEGNAHAQREQSLHPELFNPLPFISVTAAGRSDALVHTESGRALPALALHWHVGADAATLAQEPLNAALAAACAGQIVAWLNDPDIAFVPQSLLRPTSSKVDLGRGQPHRPLQPGDIAVLVHTAAQAALIQAELRARGLNSVYVSERQSVFSSPQARDLLHWLRAVHNPLDPALARTALGTHLMGLNLAELQTLARDDAALDAYTVQLASLRTVWQRQGVLAMLRQSLHRFDWAARWASAQAIEHPHDAGHEGDEGDIPAHDLPAENHAPPSQRAITNYLHLAELLQNASAAVEGPQALIRWLQTHIQNPNHDADEQLMRLESDAALIQIVTIHKSKGLEYPVVCLPFAHRLRPAARSETLFLRDSDLEKPANINELSDPMDSERPVHLNFTAADMRAADWQRLREDVRLLYVAATRARHVLWLGAGPVRIGNSPQCQAHRSALGYVLAGPDPVSAEDIQSHWQSWVNELQDIENQEDFANTPLVTAAFTQGDAPTRAPRTLWQPRTKPAPLQAAPIYSAAFERDWSIGSFSALVRNLHDGPTVSDAHTPRLPDAILPRHIPGDDEAEHDSHIPTTAPALEPSDAAAPWHRIERGALLGNFMHEQLQWLREQVAMQSSAAAGTPECLLRPTSSKVDLGRGQPLELPPATAAALLRRCQRSAWAEQAQPLTQWLSAIAHAPLLPAAAPYRTANTPPPTLLSLAQAMPELEFWLNAPAHLSAERIDALCQQHILPGHPRPRLPERTLHGMLMGFADLVFIHQGRCWVLDYKTNQLGPDAHAYTRADLQAAFLEHRYDVQAAIYLLAAHRLLRQRLGAAYEASQHLGGAIYFFVRGLDAPTGGLLDLHTDTPLLKLITTLDMQLSPCGLNE